MAAGTQPITRTDGVMTDYFAGELRRFALPIFGEFRLLQDRHDLGPMGFEHVLRAGAWKVEHVSDVIKFGLIGGGMDEAEAARLVETTIQAGRLLKYVPLAHAIVLVALGPMDPETAPKKPPAARKPRTKKSAAAS